MHHTTLQDHSILYMHKHRGIQTPLKKDTIYNYVHVHISKCHTQLKYTTVY